MSNEKLEKYLKYVLITISFTPLLYLSGFFFPFVILKALYFRILVQIAALIFAVLFFRRYSGLKYNLSIILVASFLVLNFVSTFFSPDWRYSFWSDYNRMDGLIGLIYLFVYLVILVGTYKEKKDWIMNIRFLILGSFAVSIYGLLQRFNLIQVFNSGTERVASTLGNPDFFSSYLLFMIGLGLYDFVTEKNKKYRYFSLATVFINFFSLLLTATRSSLLGFFTAVFIFLLINISFNRKFYFKTSLGLLVLIMGLTAGFFVYRGNLKHSNIQFIQRMASISLSEGNVSNRLTAWRYAWQGFKDKPVIGYGIENYRIVFNKYFEPNTDEQWFDRAHNAYLDQLVYGGTIGFIFYISILAITFVNIFRSRKDDFWLFAIICPTLIAYAIQNIFIFDSLNTSFIYFFIIGLTSVVLIQKTFFLKERAKIGNKKQKELKVPFSISLFLAAANIMVFYYVVYLPFWMNRNLFMGHYYTLADEKRSLESYKKALSRPFSANETVRQLNDSYTALVQNPKTSASILSEFKTLTKDKIVFAIEKYPSDIRNNLLYAQFIAENYKDKNELEKAEYYLKKAIESSPGRPESTYLLFNTYLLKDDEKLAVAIMNDFIKKYDWFGEPKIILANAIMKKDKKMAYDLFEKGIKQYYRPTIDNYKVIISYLLFREEYKRVIPFYEMVSDREPDNFDYKMDLIKLYYLSGDKVNAKKLLLLILDKKPDILIQDNELKDILK